jgi:hypothetical protein
LIDVAIAVALVAAAAVLIGILLTWKNPNL